MKENITVDRIVNSILQRRKKFDNFILAEGNHDRLFLLKFKNENSQIEITFGWEKLIEIVSKLKERGFDKVIGIIDKDLREIIPENVSFDENIILTDEHDINILCLEKTFSLIFNSYCSDDKVENFKNLTKNQCLKQYTYNLMQPLSFLKILNKRQNLNLSFKSNDSKKNRLDYFKFIDKTKYELISLEKLVETITNFSRSKTEHEILSNEKIVEKLKQLIKSEKHDNSKLNSGHDFGEIICLGLKRVLGSKDIDSETFLKEAILSYDNKDFISTNIYKKIKELEVRHNTNYIK